VTLSKVKNRLTQFTIKRDEREDNKERKKKRPRRHIKSPMTTPPVLLERYR